MRKGIPNFFLIGPMKAGTTAVAEGLKSHPDIFLSEVKEPCFFIYQGGNPHGWEAGGKDSLEWYLGLYREAQSQKAVGDASPYYISMPHCAREIRNFNPEAKIIAILRNPVLRAFSMYRYWHTNTSEPISADDFVECFLNEKLVHDSEQNRSGRFGWLQGNGFYGRLLQAYFGAFPREQIKVLFYDELVNDPRLFYERIYRHLGVATAEDLYPENREVNPTVERKFKGLHRWLNRGYHGPIARTLKKAKIDVLARGLREGVNSSNVKPKSRQLKFPAERYGELITVYRDDIALLEDMLGVDLEGWRNNTML